MSRLLGGATELQNSGSAHQMGVQRTDPPCYGDETDTMTVNGQARCDSGPGPYS